MIVQSNCLSADLVEQYLQGNLSAEEAESIEQHLLDCSRCLDSLAAKASTITFYEAAASTASHAEELKASEGEIAELKIRLKAMTTHIARPAVVPDTVDGSGNRSTDTWSVSPGTADGQGQHAPPPTMPEFTHLGKCELLGMLGHGGMGMVCRAMDHSLNREVALKLLLPRLAADAIAQQRFTREARAAASIKSDHVVTIHYVGEDKGNPFLVMELLEGWNLLDWLKSRGNTVPHQDVLRVGLQLLEGLAAAHKKGLIHRDIKPNNIWIEHSGRVKLLDFGLGRHVDAHDLITSAGTIVGTAAFMAPEQADAKLVDRRCDLFSVGVVLYSMATGSSPFEQGKFLATLKALATLDPVPLAVRIPGFPSDLSRFIARLMSKDLEGRPADATAALEELQEIEVRPAIAPRRRWPKVAGLVAACLLFPVVLTIAWPEVIVIIRGKDGQPDIVVKAKDVKSVEVIDTKTGKTTTVKIASEKDYLNKNTAKPPPTVEDLRAGTPIVISARFADTDSIQAFEDSGASLPHFAVESVKVGAKGVVIRVSTDNNSCCLRLESAPNEEVWVSLDNVKRR